MGMLQRLVAKQEAAHKDMRDVNAEYERGNASAKQVRDARDRLEDALHKTAIERHGKNGR